MPPCVPFEKAPNSLEQRVPLQTTPRSIGMLRLSEIWKEKMFALWKVKGRWGNRKVIQSLDDVIIGNKARIKRGIRLSLEENTRHKPSHLLKALVKAGMLKTSIRHMTFHRAIELFPPTELWTWHFTETIWWNQSSPQRGSNFAKAKRTIDLWTDYFVKKDSRDLLFVFSFIYRSEKIIIWHIYSLYDKKSVANTCWKRLVKLRYK